MQQLLEGKRPGKTGPAGCKRTQKVWLASWEIESEAAGPQSPHQQEQIQGEHTQGEQIQGDHPVKRTRWNPVHQLRREEDSSEVELVAEEDDSPDLEGPRRKWRGTNPIGGGGIGI